MTPISNAALQTPQDGARLRTASGDAPAAGISVGRAVLAIAIAVALGGVFTIFIAPAPLGFKVTGWLFAAAIIAASRQRRSGDGR